VWKSRPVYRRAHDTAAGERDMVANWLEVRTSGSFFFILRSCILVRSDIIIFISRTHIKQALILFMNPCLYSFY